LKAATAHHSPAQPPPFPWAAALRFGVGRLRLSPDAFWALTPRELAMLAGLDRAGGEAPTHADLAALMRRFSHLTGDEP
jgi:uncharacterized phage protein (TIGR02216 family)